MFNNVRGMYEGRERDRERGRLLLGPSLVISRTNNASSGRFNDPLARNFRECAPHRPQASKINKSERPLGISHFAATVPILQCRRREHGAPVKIQRRCANLETLSSAYVTSYFHLHLPRLSLVTGVSRQRAAYRCLATYNISRRGEITRTRPRQPAIPRLDWREAFFNAPRRVKIMRREALSNAIEREQ